MFTSAPLSSDAPVVVQAIRESDSIHVSMQSASYTFYSRVLENNNKQNEANFRQPGKHHSRETAVNMLNPRLGEHGEGMVAALFLHT